MIKADGMGIPVSSKSIDAIVERAQELDLVFDATTAQDHVRHAPILEKLGLLAIDLTPAKVGLMCVPAVNLQDCLQARNVNMVSCGGQAAIPLAHAIAEASGGDSLDYIETISMISSRSAGPATRINLDEYLGTTENGLQMFSGCDKTKAILNLNPAQPCVHMQTTVFAQLRDPDLTRIRAAVGAVTEKLRKYIPGYQLILEPILENGRVAVMVRVEGLGDYLPKYAGNLDIINCAAVAMAEAYAENGITRR
jgi:acetaldehyde dehydrogenase